MSAADSLVAQPGEGAVVSLVLRARQRTTRALAVTPTPSSPSAAALVPRTSPPPMPNRRKAPALRRTTRADRST